MVGSQAYLLKAYEYASSQNQATLPRSGFVHLALRHGVIVHGSDVTGFDVSASTICYLMEAWSSICRD